MLLSELGRSFVGWDRRLWFPKSFLAGSFHSQFHKVDWHPDLCVEEERFIGRTYSIILMWKRRYPVDEGRMNPRNMSRGQIAMHTWRFSHMPTDGWCFDISQQHHHSLTAGDCWHLAPSSIMAVCLSVARCELDLLRLLISPAASWQQPQLGDFASWMLMSVSCCVSHTTHLIRFHLRCLIRLNCVHHSSCSCSHLCLCVVVWSPRQFC